jgi:excisionase family DNA binding protein
METLTFESLPQAVSQLCKKLDNLERLLLAKTEQQPEPSDILLTIEEASDFLHLSKATIYSKVSKRELPYMKRSKRLYFSRIELTEYLQGGRNKTNEEIQASADEYLRKSKKRA